MDTVAGQHLGLGSFGDRIVEHGLKGYPDCSCVVGDGFGILAADVELWEPFVTVFLDRTAHQNERLTDHECRRRKGVSRTLQQRGKPIAIRFRRSVVTAVELVPDVVNSDQDAENLGLNVDTVLLPATAPRPRHPTVPQS